jgi:hypothetical protein
LASEKGKVEQLESVLERLGVGNGDSLVARDAGSNGRRGGKKV